MEEIARVERIEDKYAYVKISKKEECSKCGMCVFPKNASEIELRALNTANAKKDDDVIIKTTEGNGKLLSSLLIFLVPLLLIGVAVLIEKAFIKNEIFILILSVVFILIWFIILSVIDKKIKNKESFISEIIKILPKEK